MFDKLKEKLNDFKKTIDEKVKAVSGASPPVESAPPQPAEPVHQAAHAPAPAPATTKPAEKAASVKPTEKKRPACSTGHWR